MSNDDGAKLVGSKGRAQFEPYYDEAVNRVCRPYTEKLKPVVDKYRLLDIGLGVFRSDASLTDDETGNFIHKWLSYSWICSKLTDTKADTLAAAHNLFFERHTGPGVSRLGWPLGVACDLGPGPSLWKLRHAAEMPRGDICTVWPKCQARQSPGSFYARCRVIGNQLLEPELMMGASRIEESRREMDERTN